jgi:hypothetical protein
MKDVRGEKKRAKLIPASECCRMIRALPFVEGAL